MPAPSLPSSTPLLPQSYVPAARPESQGKSIYPTPSQKPFCTAPARHAARAKSCAWYYSRSPRAAPDLDVLLPPPAPQYAPYPQRTARPPTSPPPQSAENQSPANKRSLPPQSFSVCAPPPAFRFPRSQSARCPAALHTPQICTCARKNSADVRASNARHAIDSSPAPYRLAAACSYKPTHWPASPNVIARSHAPLQKAPSPGQSPAVPPCRQIRIRRNNASPDSPPHTCS